MEEAATLEVKEVVNKLAFQVYTLEAVVEGLIQTLEGSGAIEEAALKAKVHAIIEEGLKRLQPAVEDTKLDDLKLV